MTTLSRIYHGFIGSLAATALLSWLTQLTYPLWLALAAIVPIAILLWHRPSAWLVLMPALWPIIDLVPWTGRMYFTESDALATLCIVLLSFRFLREDHYPETPQKLYLHNLVAIVLLGGVALSYIISSIKVLIPLPPIDENAFIGYDSPFNALRLAKGIVWPLLLLPHWSHAQRRLGTTKLFCIFRTGMTTSFAVVSLVALWERLAFQQFLDFATNYRTTALFWEMNVGGAAFDGWLMLTLPFTVFGMLAARRPFSILLHLAVLALGAYAILTTFSRGVYLGVAVMLGVAIIAWWRSHRRVHNPLLRKLAWHHQLMVPVLTIFVALVAAAVFHSGGYRGLATLLASMTLVYVTAPLLGPMNARQWFPLYACTLPLWTLSYLLHDIFEKAAYIYFAVALTAAIVVGIRVWKQPDDATAKRLLAIFVLWCASSTSWINLHWGGSEALPAGAIASGMIVLTLFFQTSRERPLWALTRKHVTVTALCTIAIVMIAVGAGSHFIGVRFSTTNEDTTGRMQHWSNGLSLIQNTAEWAIGIGIGRYTSRYSLLVPGNQYPGAWRIETETTSATGEPNDYLRLFGSQHPNGRQLLRVTQNIGFDLAGPFTVKLHARSAKQVTLRIEVCQKHLLFSANCAVAPFVKISEGNRWEKIEIPLSNQVLTENKLWLAPRNIVFTIATNDDHGQTADFDNLELVNNHGHNLLANGNFKQGADRWFFTSDHVHLPFHAKSMVIHLLIEQGIFGAIAVFTLVFAAFWRLAFGRIRDTHYAIPCLAALAGFLTVGLFDSLLDVPRVSSFFFLLVAASLISRPSPNARTLVTENTLTNRK